MYRASNAVTHIFKFLWKNQTPNLMDISTLNTKQQLPAAKALVLHNECF